jgi:hypothetical protein
MRFQAPQETATGIIAGAYVFQYTFPAPPPNPYFTGDSVVTQSTAYSLASVNLQPIIADGIGSVPPVGADGVAPGTVDSAGLPNLVDAGAVPIVPLSPVASGSDPSVSLVGFKIGLGVDNLYLAVAALALLGLLGFAGTSWLGVRSR